jgi:flagellar basal-body rod protein FlgB
MLARLLSASELRARVLAANVANQNTPGYTRRVVHFEDHLREAVRRGADPARVAPEVVEDVATAARPDGNNVTLEVELNAMRENRILYETYATIMKGHFDLLEASLG